MTTTDTRVEPRTGSRLHSLDALRAGALLLGIVLHSLMPFVPGMPWLVSDSRTSEVAWIPIYLIHLFRMALFMLLAGYFGRLVLHRRGTASYLRDRALRIGLPLIAFWPVAVGSLGILVYVNLRLYDVAPPAPPESGAAAMFTPGQLWFLWVLLQCVVIVVAFRALAVRVLGARRSGRAIARIGRWLSLPASLLLAAVPYCLALLLQGNTLGGIMAPATLMPSAPALTAYLGAFVVGWALQADRESMTRIARWWPLYFAVAVISSAIGFVVSDPSSGAALPVAAGVLALAGWSWVYGLLGVCVRFLHSERAWIRYLADSSYWMYLLHLPLLVGFEIALVPLAWPIAVKLALTWLVVSAILLGSYQLLVRPTWVGKWLNGHRYPRKRALADHAG